MPTWITQSRRDHEAISPGIRVLMADNKFQVPRIQDRPGPRFSRDVAHNLSYANDSRIVGYGAGLSSDTTLTHCSAPQPPGEACTMIDPMQWSTRGSDPAPVCSWTCVAVLHYQHPQVPRDDVTRVRMDPRVNVCACVCELRHSVHA